MPLEAASYIKDLNPSNPVPSDGLGQGDDHIRLIKSATTNTFTEMDGATDITPATLNDLQDGIFKFADGTLTAPALKSASEATLGIYRVAAGKLGLSQGKRLVGNGMVPVGSLHHFPKLPPAGTYTSGGVATANPERIEYIENDGSIYNIADFPDLGAYLGNTFGGNGTTTFAVPNEKDTGRFRRSRDGSTSLGAYQSSQNKAHTHTLSGTADSSGSAHTHTGTTASAGDHSHTYSNMSTSTAVQQSGATFAIGYSGAQGQTTGTAGAHTHTFTTDSSGAHSHTLSGTAVSDGGTEARPEALICFACSKT